MAIDEKDTAPRLGKLPENIRLKPALGRTDNKTDSKPLIGGKDSSYLGSLAGNVASGFGSVVSSPFEAADRALAALAGVEYRPEVASPIGKLGQGIEGAIETVAAPDPERQEDFSSKLGAGVGSALGFMLPFAAAGNVGRAGQAAISGGLGATATGVEQATDYDQARKAAGLEADPNDQAASLFYGMLPGTLEAVPIARMFGRLDNIAKGGLQAAVKNTAKGTAEEALQEGVQSIASNLIASDVVRYDPNRGMFFDSGEAAAVGGGVGFLMNSVFNALGLRGARRARYEQMAQQVSQGQAPVQDEQNEKVNPATGEEFENSQIGKVNKKIKQYQKLAETEPQNEAAYKRRIKELKDELNTKFVGPDATGSAIDRQEATDVLSEEQADQQLGLPGIEQAEVQKPTQETAPVEEEAQVPENQLALDFEQEVKPEAPAVTEAKRKLDEILTPVETIEEDEVVTQDDLVVAPEDTQDVVEEEEAVTPDEEVQEAEEELILTDEEVQQIAASPSSDIARALKNATEDERGRILKAINDRALAEKARQQEQADADIARAEEEAKKARSIEPIDNTTYDEKKPFSGVMHTLRNNEDLESVIESGLQETTNIGTANSQAIGEGITLEYDANDLTYLAKGYRTEEGMIDKQVDAKPKRVLVDMSDPAMYGVKEGAQGEDWASSTMDKLYETVKDGYTSDEYMTDIGYYLDAFTASPKRKEHWDDIKEYTTKYGLQSTAEFKDVAVQLQAAMDNPSTTEVPAVTEQDVLRDISRKVPVDIPIYTYTVDENGRPENIALYREKVGKVEKAPKPRKPSEISNVVPEGYVGTKSGKAFASERSAKANRTKNKLTATHDVVYIEQGWVLKLKDDQRDLPVAPPTNKQIQDIIESVPEEPAAKDKPRYTPQEADIESLTIDSELYDTVLKVGDRLLDMQRKGEIEGPETAESIIRDIFDNDIQMDDFIKLYAGIKDGTVKKESEAIETPLGAVEKVEIVQAEPAEVQLVTEEQNLGELEEVTKRLDQLDKELIELEEQIAEGYYEPSEAQKMRARIKRSIRNSEARQSSLLGNAKKIADKEIAEAVAAEHTVEIIEDLDAEFLPDGSNAKPRPSQREVVRTRNITNKFYDSISPEIKKDLKVFVVNDFTDIPSQYPELRQEWKDNWGNQPYLGLHINPTSKRPETVVLIKPTAGKTDEQIQWTLFHEVVGHYGFKKMFHKDWTRFMELSLKNKDLASKALALRDRWTHIEIAPKKGQPTIKVNAKYTYNRHGPTTFNRFIQKVARDQQEIEVDLEGMRRLMDEYVAEIAANMSNQTFRDAVASEQTFLKRVIAWIRHLFRKAGFGKISSQMTQSDLLAFVGESYARITGDGKMVDDQIVNERALEKVSTLNLKKIDAKEAFAEMTKSAIAGLKTPAVQARNKALFQIDDPFTAPATVSLTDDAIEAQAAIDETVDNAIEARIIKTRDEARSIIDAIRQRKGRIDNSAWARRVEIVSDKIRRSRAGRILSSTGHLNEPRILNAVESITKGGIERGQSVARKFANKTKNLNDIQKEAIYNYFKTKDASVNTLPVNDEIKTLTRDTKQYIEDLGESLVHLGLMRRETWEADRGSYLSIRYWKYVQNYYAAGGKRLSFKNYLKKQKGLSDAEKQALGEIKDPAFIVPETVATISRDVALHSMFKNILTMDKVGGLGWVLGNSQYVEVDGKKMRLSDIETNIETLEMLQEADEGISPLWRTPEGQEEIERQLQQLYDARERAEGQLRNELTQVLQQRGEPITDDRINQLLRSEFVKVRDKRYGPLYNKHIRKELYEEIVDSGEMYNKEHTDFMGQWFGMGGKAEKAHQIWKASKVVLNPPSWVRNGIGNMVLLDIGSGTNTIKLVGMVADEFNSWRTGNLSKYFHWAHEQGLWNTTFSASELNLMSDQFQEKFKTEINFTNETKLFKKLWWFTQGKFANALEKATNIYGGMEGFFKTVALRDHIQQWEAKNGPLERADSVTQQAVIREAAETANKNIFDYSRVPGWMRTMRRMPFVGAPFLTYTFKAIPQSIESFASRPHKMIKYAAFPYVMAQWFMMENDLDDDDFEELKNKLPKWQKEQSSVFLLPWKDGNGKWQTMDFGYYLPWAAMHNTALQISSTFDSHNPLMSSLEATGKSFMDLGFLGGPMPSMISGMITNKDPFLGQEIVRTDGTPGDKTNDLMRYMVDLWAPTFLTSKGVLGRTLDNLGVEPTPYLGWYHTGRELDNRGIDRETAIQSSLRGIGVNVRGFDPQAETIRKVKSYQHEKRGLEKARRDVFKDRNISAESKAAKARDINQQIKLLNERHRKELHGV